MTAMLTLILIVAGVFAGCFVIALGILARFAHQNHLRMRLRDGRVMVDCETKPETGAGNE